MKTLTNPTSEAAGKSEIECRTTEPLIFRYMVRDSK